MANKNPKTQPQDLEYNEDGLTHQEQLFILHYCTYMDEGEAVKVAYPKVSGFNNYGKRLLKKTKIAKAIDKRMKELKDEFFIDEETVLRGLYAEATNKSSTPNARIQAWVNLGKHLGMFQTQPKGLLTKEEAKSQGTQINIINYNKAPTEGPTKPVERDVTPQEDHKLEKLNDVIEITDYTVSTKS